jgi:hypothetical protein
VKCSRMRSSFSALSCALSTILFFWQESRWQGWRWRRRRRKEN